MIFAHVMIISMCINLLMSAYGYEYLPKFRRTEKDNALKCASPPPPPPSQGLCYAPACIMTSLNTRMPILAGKD